MDARRKLWAIGFGLFFLSLFVFPGLLGLVLPLPYNKPGESPPWYFIREDFLTGMGCLVSFLMTIPLVIWGWRSQRATSFLILWQSLLWQGYHISQSLGILFRTDHLFIPEKAISPWLTFHEYLNDPLQKNLGNGAIILGLTVSIVGTYVFRGIDRAKKSTDLRFFLIIAILTFLVIVTFLTPITSAWKNATPGLGGINEFSESTEKDEIIKLYVPRSSIEAGTVITEDKIVEVIWPRKYKPSGAISDSTKLIGKIAVVTLNDSTHPIVQNNLRDY